MWELKALYWDDQNFFTKIYITTTEKINKKVKYCSFIYYYIEKTGSLQRSCLRGHTKYTKQKRKGIGNRREDLSTYDIIIKKMQRLWLAILEKLLTRRKVAAWHFLVVPLSFIFFKLFAVLAVCFIIFFAKNQGWSPSICSNTFNHKIYIFPWVITHIFFSS